MPERDPKTGRFISKERSLMPKTPAKQTTPSQVPVTPRQPKFRSYSDPISPVFPRVIIEPLDIVESEREASSQVFRPAVLRQTKALETRTSFTQRQPTPSKYSSASADSAQEQLERESTSPPAPKRSPSHLPSISTSPSVGQFKPHRYTKSINIANQSSEPPLNGYEIAYSKASYKRDAAFIIAVNEEIGKGGFLQLQSVLQDSDVRDARIILKLVSADRRAELRDQANSAIHSQNTSASTAATFTRFLIRFRNGPTEIDEDRDTPEQRNERPENARQSSQLRQQSDLTEDISRSFSFHRDNLRRDRDHNTRRDNARSSHHRRHRREPSYSSSNSSSSSDDDFYRRRRHERSPRKSRRHRHRETHKPHYYSAIPLSAFSQAKLRPNELAFDRTTLVTSYINRIEYLADTYGEPIVLAVLPIALSGDALNWFDSLDNRTRRTMNTSLDEWTHQLRARFQANASLALEEADALRHSFTNESKLDIRQYITKKTQLYMEAGEIDQDLVVRRLYRGLDPTLAAAVKLRSRNTIAEFCSRVYEAEPAARAQFNQIGDLLKDRQRTRTDHKDKSSDYKDKGYRTNWQEKQYQIPLEAARQLANAVRYNKPLALPAPAYPKRQVYPCTYCGSNEHIDPQCPSRPKPKWQNRANNNITNNNKPVPVNFADTTETIVNVDEDTYHRFLDAQQDASTLDYDPQQAYSEVESRSDTLEPENEDRDH